MKAVVIVSFGTANLEGVKILEEFEREINEKLKGKYNIFKAFTSSSISNILFNRYGKVVPRLEEILYKLSNDKYKEVYIQPLHIIEGSEYSYIEKVLKEYTYSFSKIRVGEILMGKNEEDLLEGCNVIYNSLNRNFEHKNSNIVLIGHGSKTLNDDRYEKIKEVFIDEGFKNIYLGKLEGNGKKEEVLSDLIKDNIFLVPILMLPGKHIKKDIFGENNSWKTLFEDNNIRVNCVEKSLLQYDEIKEYYLNKIYNNIK